MDTVEIAKQLLAKIGMPKQQQSEICALTLLAMANIPKNGLFTEASNEWIRIHDVIIFIAEQHDKPYAENSRETFRKQAMHHFRNAALIEDNGKATNSPNYSYRITNEFLNVIKSIGPYGDGINGTNDEIEHFVYKHKMLVDTYASKKKMEKIPVTINNKKFTFSPGAHNVLQKAVLDEFVPRFVPTAECLYLGDTADKDLYKDVDKLKELGFDISVHDKMPDVVLYVHEADPTKNWLCFVECVTSVGPMNPKRLLEIKELTKNVKAKQAYITAFLEFKAYKRFSQELAWETEVWLAEAPEHMIHLNGDRFFGPR